MRPLVGAAALPVPPGYATGPMLSDCCLSCPICLSVNLVYCGQTVGWIKMKLGMQVGLLCPGHNVLDGDPPPIPQRRTAPQFSAHICCGKMAGWIKMPLGMEVGFGPGNCVRWGPSSPKKGHSPPPIFGPCLLWPNGCMHQDTTCGTEEGLSLGDIVLDGDSAPPRKGAQQPPPLLAHVLWPNGWMDQDTTWYGRRPQPRLCVRCGPSPFHFWPMSIVAKRSPSQQLLSSLLIYCW